MLDPDRCPSCGSPEPHLHPATQAEGEVTRICPSSWHEGVATDHPFTPIPLYDADGRNPIFTDWCGHMVGPEHVCARLASRHQPAVTDCPDEDLVIGGREVPPSETMWTSP